MIAIDLTAPEEEFGHGHTSGSEPDYIQTGETFAARQTEDPLEKGIN